MPPAPQCWMWISATCDSGGRACWGWVFRGLGIRVWVFSAWGLGLGMSGF